MKNYNIAFTYNIQVEAKDKQEAERKAMDIFDEIMPRTDEMNINVEKE